MSKKFFRSLNLVSIMMLLAFMPALASAQTYSSNSYSVDEAVFGSGGEVDTSSNSYRAQGAAGILGVGDSSSANYDSTGGFITPNEVYLEFWVSNSTVDLGILDPNAYSSGSAQSGDCNCSFYVRTYLSDAYVVTTLSDPPTSEAGRVMNAKTVLGAPSATASVEEFGMNLVDNTSPNIGANSANIPDNTFADGIVETGYNTVDQFKYNKGDIIARSAGTLGNQATGQTNFTISYIAKSSPITPAGLYNMAHDLVVTARF